MLVQSLSAYEMIGRLLLMLIPLCDNLFAQVGQLYIVYHIWAYPSMCARNETRHATWAKPGWDATVAYTGQSEFEFEEVLCWTIALFHCFFFAFSCLILKHVLKHRNEK